MTTSTELVPAQDDLNGARPGSKTYVMQGSQESGFISNVLPEAIAAMSKGALVSPDVVRAELDAMASAVREFWSMEPDLVMRDCAAYSARCTELAMHLHRIEGRERTYRQIRTLQVGPLLEELDRQFKIASRLVEVRRQDIALSGGHV